MVLDVLLRSAQDTNAALDQGATDGPAAEACRSAESTPTSETGGGALSSIALAGEQRESAGTHKTQLQDTPAAALSWSGRAACHQPSATAHVPAVWARPSTAAWCKEGTQKMQRQPPCPVSMLCAGLTSSAAAAAEQADAQQDKDDPACGQVVSSSSSSSLASQVSSGTTQRDASVLDMWVTAADHLHPLDHAWPAVLAGVRPSHCCALTPCPPLLADPPPMRACRTAPLKTPRLAPATATSATLRSASTSPRACAPAATSASTLTTSPPLCSSTARRRASASTTCATSATGACCAASATTCPTSHSSARCARMHRATSPLCTRFCMRLAGCSNQRACAKGSGHAGLGRSACRMRAVAGAC